MNILRRAVEWHYAETKLTLFDRTRDDPEIAHEKFIRNARRLHNLGLDRLLFDCKENRRSPGFTISNAAGFNKNAEIHPLFLKYLGFDRVEIGTVCADPWNGQPRPRIKRYVDTGSLVNWMGLHGLGAE